MSSLFDQYVMVDWSASNVPTMGKDSIWIGCAERNGDAVTLKPSVNPATREAAMRLIKEQIRSSIQAGRRLLLGFDFPFGYPVGAAKAIAGREGWKALWARMGELVRDRPDNKSNRFEVGGILNMGPLANGPMFWGRPAHLDIAGLPAKMPLPYSRSLPKRRVCEDRAPRAQPVWKLAYPGSVGSQALLGIARLQELLKDPEFSGHLTVWPFETNFEDRLAGDCILAEIYPSLFPVALGDRSCLDEAQVETLAEGFATADAAGELRSYFESPSGLSDEERSAVLGEEGWILGISKNFSPKPSLERKPAAPARINYIRDPRAIYAASFAAVRAEVDLGGLPAEAHDLAVRLVHACGMGDIVDDLVVSPGAVEAGRAALRRGAPILCDAEMVAHGIVRRLLPAFNPVVCRLNDTAVAPLADRLRTTRSAAQVDLWTGDLGGAVVAIGNAPTALFRLLERLDAGAPRPAVILGLPVGFVGAAEAKAELAEGGRGVPFVTLLGRRGGSALAAAAVNALAAGLGEPAP